MEIEREKHPWGVRLTMRPLSNREIRIVGELKNPVGGKQVDAFFWFDGVLKEKPMRATELRVWQQAVGQFLIEAKDLSEQMLAKSRKKKD